MTKECALIDGIIYCQCGDQSSHYGTMGKRGAREVRCEAPPQRSSKKVVLEIRRNKANPKPWSLSIVRDDGSLFPIIQSESEFEVRPAPAPPASDHGYVAEVLPHQDRIVLDGQYWALDTVRAALKAHGRTLVTTPEPAQPLTTLTSPRSALWRHMHDEHGLTLLESELDEIERLAKACSADEPPPALRPDGMPEPSLDVLKRVAARMRETAADTAYLAQWAVDQIEEHNQSFDLRWKADMRAIKRWQEAHPGNDLTWPDHADLCVWLLEQFDARASQPPEAWRPKSEPIPAEAFAFTYGDYWINLPPHPQMPTQTKEGE